MTAQVAADLRAAADVLRRDGWTQGGYHRFIDGRFCHCAVGAIEAGAGFWHPTRPLAFGDLGQRASDAWDALKDSLGRRDREAVFDWNDDESRTADEVIAALEAAADAAEAQS